MKNLQLFTYALFLDIYFISNERSIFSDFKKQTIKSKNLDDSLFSRCNLPENAVKVKSRNITVHKFLEKRFHGDVKLDSREVETGT